MPVRLNRYLASTGVGSRRAADEVIRAGRVTVNGAAAEVGTLVSDITTPTLIIQGRRDTVVEPRKAAWLHDHLGSTRKALVVLPRSDHLVALDRDRERAVSLTRDFVLGRGEVFEASAR